LRQRGHRLEIYINEKHADDIIKISQSFNIDAKIIGRVESSDSKKLTIQIEKGIFNY